MTARDDLVATALLGTARRELHAAAAGGRLGAVVEGLAERPPEARLLAAAGALAVHARAGERAPLATAEPPPPAPPDERPLVPESAVRLFWVLVDDYDALRDEWAALVEARGWRPPPETLPLLGEYPVAGPRGRWLEEQLGEVAAPSRAEVEAMWDDVPAARKAPLIQALGGTLNPDDIPFLERVLHDSRKTARRSAARLLVRLPESPFAQRVGEVAAPLLELRRGRIAARRAGRVDEAVADLIGGTTPELVAAAPLATWTERFGLDAQAIVDTPVAKEWRDVVHEAWSSAALDQRDTAWARALAPLGREPELLDVLDRDEAERLALDLVGEVTLGGIWSEPLSRAWIEQMDDDPEAYGVGAHLAPETLEDAERALEQKAARGDWHSRAAVRGLELVRFRRAMLAALG